MKRQNRKEGNGEIILLRILPMHRCCCRGCRIAPFQSQPAVMGMGQKHLFCLRIATHILSPEVIVKSFGNNNERFSFSHPVEDEGCSGVSGNGIAGNLHQGICLPEPFLIDRGRHRAGKDSGEVKPFLGIFEPQALGKTGNRELRSIVERLQRIQE